VRVAAVPLDALDPCFDPAILETFATTVVIHCSGNDKRADSAKERETLTLRGLLSPHTCSVSRVESYMCVAKHALIEGGTQGYRINMTWDSFQLPDLRVLLAERFCMYISTKRAISRSRPCMQ
jgi:hypothetical protein